MSPLSRRCDPDRADECWLIFTYDVHVGRIARAIGNPGALERWQWHCGFYPGSKPDEQLSGTASSFDKARSDFVRAWKVFSSKRTEADYQAWRDQRDWTARKYAMWERGERLPSQEVSR